eukprot:6189844-Pleurochrysis_carterae.AAC.2
MSAVSLVLFNLTQSLARSYLVSVPLQSLLATFGCLALVSHRSSRRRPGIVQAPLCVCVPTLDAARPSLLLSLWF